jgi:hypothetical protein
MPLENEERVTTRRNPMTQNPTMRGDKIYECVAKTWPVPESLLRTNQEAPGPI